MKRIFCIGVFDVPHRGHFVLLERASELGTLTVGVVRDAAVKKQKGANRPIMSESDRSYMISRVKGVDCVIFLDDFAFPEDVLKEYDIIVVGGDQTHLKNLDQIPNDKRYNLPRTEGVSSSELIKKCSGK